MTWSMWNEWCAWVHLSELYIEMNSNDVLLALKLGQQESLNDKVDLEVIELAALCHDIGDAKYKLEHEGVLKFLTRHDYDKAALVAQIVDHVGYRKELKWKKEDTLATWRDTCVELHV